MWPMAAVTVVAVCSVSGLGAWLGVRAAKARIEAQVAEVAMIVEAANFPLTAPVLVQMKALSGAELFVVADDGQVQASSRAGDCPFSMTGPVSQSGRKFDWSRRETIAGRSYFHTVVTLPEKGDQRESRLHILYPEDEYFRAWQQAVYPSMAFMALALPVVLLLAWLTGTRLAGRVARLQQQVERIEGGEFTQIALFPGDDEIRALGAAVNRMSAMLANYEQEVRRTERMRTLAHLGGGIAHQLRNSATGCALALDLHAEECPMRSTSSALAVAKRQLRLMEEYLQRFLQLGKTDGASRAISVNVTALIDQLLPLVQPAARHARVDLQWLPREGAAHVVGRSERLGQAIVNLVLNAVEAAAARAAIDPDRRAARVTIELSREFGERLRITISDNGAGPAEAVRDRLFEPFVTEKPDGVGLGLSVAREVIEEHGGEMSWRRANGITYFTVHLPCEAMEPNCVEFIGCR
jgi:signal transduction histidine kinase